MKEENKSQKAFEIDKSIKDNELQRRKLFISNILSLVQMYDEGLYKHILGEGVEPNWAGYLGDIQKYYTRSKIERWRKIINKLIKKFGIDINSFIEVPETRLEAISRVSETKEEAESLIMDAKILTARDFRDLINKKLGKPTTDNCEHKFVEYAICLVCGLKNKK